MDFRTSVTVEWFNKRIAYNDELVFIGSCFADEIGRCFAENKFIVSQNPFGVLYNPVSISESLCRLISKREYSANDVFKDGNLYHSFGHHSSFSDTDLDRMLGSLNTALVKASSTLHTAKFLFVTFGTSWVYELKQSGRVVANCHKLPASVFTRRRISSTEMFEMWRATLSSLFEFNSDIKIVLTVSPIRHLRDGAHENSLSKSELLLLSDMIRREYPDKILYFPAYEIILDELRDYRFYDTDMVHPSKQAVEYVRELLWQNALDGNALTFTKEYGQIRSALLHRKLTADNSAYVVFLKNLSKKIDSIQKCYLEKDFSVELSEIENRIKESQLL